MKEIENEDNSYNEDLLKNNSYSSQKQKSSHLSTKKLKSLNTSDSNLNNNNNTSTDHSSNINTSSNQNNKQKNKNRKKNKNKKRDQNSSTINNNINSINAFDIENNNQKEKSVSNNHNNNKNSAKQKEPSNQQKIEEANNQMQNMNYEKAEEIYKSLYESCKNYSNQFVINLLNNCALCLYHQRKFEEAAQIASKIIFEYDNKNKRAYLMLLKILYAIKEYKKATELIEKLSTIFKKPKDFELFKGIIYKINCAISEEEDNKLRDIYYNKQKKVVDFLNNKWLHLSLCTLGTFIGGFALYKMIKK